MHSFARIAVLSLALFAVADTCAQQPKITNAQVMNKDAGRGLQPELDALRRESAAVWVGYSIATLPGFHSNWNNGTAYLEDDHKSYRSGQDSESKASGQGVILLRVKNGAVEKIRVESPERELDAAGLRFVWLANVAAEDSVHILASIAKQGDGKGLSDAAVFAVSVHATPSATDALIALTAAGNDPALREKAALWLANQRGRAGFEAIQRLARTDGDAAFRNKLTFDLTLTHETEAIPELVRMAHEDASVQVRRQAQFWMAQKGGKVVTADLRNMAENDPEASLRKSAVFAISQLPKEQATGQLIQLAQTGKDPAVRKQAVFWLGQSNDPKALEYLTQLLQK